MLGIVFYTGDVEHDIYGYSDKVHLLVGMDNKGIIKGVKVLQHQETPGFFRKIVTAKYLDRFKQKKAVEALMPNKDVDTVTGATVTSNAIINTINVASKHYVINVLKLKKAEKSEEKPSALFLSLRKKWDTIAILFVILVLGLAAYFTSNGTFMDHRGCRLFVFYWRTLSKFSLHIEYFECSIFMVYT